MDRVDTLDAMTWRDVTAWTESTVVTGLMVPCSRVCSPCIRHARLPIVFVVHGTRKFLDRVREPTAARVEQSTTVLGDWYATVLFWKSRVALFVNESTLLPVLMPFAPAASVIDRFPATVATVLGAHGVSRTFMERELVGMSEHRLAKTTNRSVVGIMNEFAHLGLAYPLLNGIQDLVALSLWLAETPCGPLYNRHGSPDRELAALASQHPD